MKPFRLVGPSGKPRAFADLRAVRKHMRRLQVGDIRDLYQLVCGVWTKIDVLSNDIEHIWHKGDDHTPRLITASLWQCGTLSE